MDEAHRFLNARQWEKIPPNFIKKMSQSRKYATNLHFVTQHQNMIDVNIRRLCNEIVIYKKFGRIMYYNSYDGAYIDQLDKDPALKPKSSGFKIYWFSKAFAQSYDTYKIFGEKFEAYQADPLWSFEVYLKKLNEHRDNQKKPRDLRQMFPTLVRGWEASKNYLIKKGGDLNGEKDRFAYAKDRHSEFQEQEGVHKSDAVLVRRETGAVRRVHGKRGLIRGL